LMHSSSSLAWLSAFFIPSLVGSHLLYQSSCIMNSEWQEWSSSSYIHVLMGTSSEPMVESLHE
jgi:hypothetical protein